MNNLKLVCSCFIFFFIITVFSSSSFNRRIHKCPGEQRDALLVFKQNISTINYDPEFYLEGGYFRQRLCEDLHGPKGRNWKRSVDCCEWDGVTCNNVTGDVISLDLSCRRLQGVSEVDKLLSALPKLEALDLSYNMLSVVTTNGGRNLNPNLYALRLAFCNLAMFPDFLRAMHNLQYLDLSGNNISSDIPAWAGEIGGNSLTYLDLSKNSITGLSEFKSDGLQYLFLDSNLIQGSFPPWICKKHLNYLSINDNRISGVVQQCLRNISSSLVSLDVSNNMIHGPFHPWICNFSSLKFLDMSYNNFHGVIPQCFGNITSSIPMINLAQNQFHGIIPQVSGYCGLTLLSLGWNKLKGEVPSSLAKCESLRLLDLGYNHLSGTFPRWVGSLQKLQILILRSNNLHGSIETPAIPEFLFPSLRIFDISHNEFVGRLPGKYFESFNAIKDVDKDSKRQFMNISSMHYYSIVPVRGSQLLNIIDFLNAVDLSSNRFEGEIPNAIGNLRSLHLLNLSNNNLNGQIPRVFRNLTNLLTLDLSRNQLVGEIPQSFVENLLVLAVLNLSHNHLVGRLPRLRGQFATFDNSSYLGNPGLCGPPLTRHCEDPISSGPAKGGAGWINIESVISGLAFGTLVGTVFGYYMLSTGRPKWVSAIADAGTRMSPRSKHKKRRQVRTRKRK